MIGEAFKLRRERRGLTLRNVTRMLNIAERKVTLYEQGGLFFTRGYAAGLSALEKLDALNKQWVLEEH